MEVYLRLKRGRDAAPSAGGYQAQDWRWWHQVFLLFLLTLAALAP